AMLRYHLQVEWPDALVDEYQPTASGRLPDAFALGAVDVVLLGYPIGGESALYWLQMLKRRQDCPPVILFASGGDEFLAVDALKSGAADYFPKLRLTHHRLIEVIRRETARAGRTASGARSVRKGGLSG